MSPRAEEGEVSDADEEFICKLVCVNLPVWYPEQAAQAPMAWRFVLPTCQATLSTLSVNALGPRLGVLLKWALSGCRCTPPPIQTVGNTKFLAMTAGICLNLGVLLRWTLDESRYISPLSKVFGNTVCGLRVLTSVFSPLLPLGSCFAHHHSGLSGFHLRCCSRQSLPPPRAA